MSFRNPRLWLSLLSLGAVLLLVFRDVSTKTSPGPLAPGHAGDPRLDAAEGCALCHGNVELDLDQACRECHQVIDEHILSRTGLHGSLDAALQKRCGSCHVEHHGTEMSLVSALAFARAGIPEITEFDHSHVAFDLVGSHEALDCEDCHPHANSPEPPRGTLRFAGTSQRCSSCHEDPHDGIYQQDCSACHGQEQPFAVATNFVHSAHLPLVGAHGEVGCEDCHSPDSAYSIAAVASFRSSLEPRGCRACHDSPHAEDFLRKVAALDGLEETAACTSCHDPEHGGFREGASITPAQHFVSGFALSEPHESLACADCHAGDSSAEASFANRFPGRDAERCESCHADYHGGQFASGAFAEAGCIECHERTSFEPHRFTALLHQRCDFPLEPAHRQVPCASCHAAPAAPATTRRFSDAPSRCDACHEDAHLGKLVRSSEHGCAECHKATRFDDVARSEFEHWARTAFPLEGAHARTDCESCHQPRERPDELGRRFGLVAAEFESDGPGTGCASCHADVHAGCFDEPTLPARVEGRRGCARCHGTDSFRELRASSFEHGLWTSFDLNGAHDAIACQSCHGQGRENSGRELGLLADLPGGSPRACADCHRDAHAGLFDQPGRPRTVEGRTSCARCHGEQDFRVGARQNFDHGQWTGYSLEGAHEKVDCDDCHIIPRANKRLGAVRGSDCADCHQDPHVGQFAGPGGRSCADCHQSTDSFAELVFDHQQHSRFALDDQHDELDCVACHRPWPLPGGGHAVRYKPLGVLCADCHASKGPRGGGG